MSFIKIIKPNKNDLKNSYKNYKKFYKETTCDICGIKFKKVSPRQYSCKCCKIILKCDYCGKIFEKTNIDKNHT